MGFMSIFNAHPIYYNRLIKSLIRLHYIFRRNLYGVLEASSHITERLREATLLRLLGEQGKLALLGDVASLAEALDGLLASRLLAATDDATTLGLYQVLLHQATGSVLGCAVEYLGLGADSGHLGTTSHHIVLTVSLAALASSCTILA